MGIAEGVVEGVVVKEWVVQKVDLVDLVDLVVAAVMEVGMYSSFYTQ